MILNVFISEKSVAESRGESVRGVVGLLRCYGLVGSTLPDEDHKPICVRVTGLEKINNDLMVELSCLIGVCDVEVL